MHKVLGHRTVTEDGGWLHEVTIQLEDGTIVTFEDDTDLLTVYASKEKALDVNQIVQLWREWGMGCSHFPAIPMPNVDPTPWPRLEHCLLQSVSTENL